VSRTGGTVPGTCRTTVRSHHFRLSRCTGLQGEFPEIDWHVWGKGRIAFPDIPIEETSSWHVCNTQEPCYIADWDTDGNFPRLKRLVEKCGLRLGSVIRVPLTTAHRRLGTLGISSQSGNAYRSEDVGFLQLLSRGIALAMEDALNLRKSQAAQAEFERQNARLKQIPLALKEFRTLEFMIKNAQRPISRDELLNEVWGFENDPYTRIVDNHILKLRQKLENDPSNPSHLVIMHGLGYKFLP
jgi:hypothetical protein